MTTILKKSETLNDYQFANKFATQFLMPIDALEKSLNEIIETHKFNKDLISYEELRTIEKELATQFEVSLETLDYRIFDLGLLKSFKPEAEKVIFWRNASNQDNTQTEK